ncbi:hypothetical protein Tco_0945307, partial [Tanacetum coccineum]
WWWAIGDDDDEEMVSVAAMEVYDDDVMVAGCSWRLWWCYGVVVARGGE